MTTRRTAAKAESFARALEQEPGGVTADPAVAAMVAVAAGLAAIPLRPAPGFKDALRTRLMAEAAQVLPSGPGAPAAPATPTVPAAPAVPAPSGLGTGWLAGPAGQIVTGGLAATVAIAGSGVAAHRSLPGDPFYGLKRAIERAQFGLAGGAVDEAVALADQARNRLDEIDAMLPDQVSALSASTIRRVDAALTTLDADLRRAIDRLLAAAAAGDARAYAELQALLASVRAALVPILAQLPDDLRARAMAVLQRVGAAGAALATIPPPSFGNPTPAPAPTSTSPSPNPSPSPSISVPTGVPSSPPPTKVPEISPSPSPTKTILPPLPTPSLPIPLPGLPGS